MHTILDAVPEPLRPWAWALVALTVAVVVALAIHALIYLIAVRITRQTEGVADTALVAYTRQPARMVLVLLAIQLVLPLLVTEGSSPDVLRQAVSVALVMSVTWLVIGALSVILDVIKSQHPIDVRDNFEARRVHTQARVLVRTGKIVVGVVGLAAVLMTFPTARQLGASLLASAGIAGLALGLAARPTISNLIAGIQLALTQPIRLDDVVIVDGEWGRIEEIKATYVVVCIWDQRRLIVPLQYFIEHPFQNWTRRTADILGTIYIYTDYSVPVEAVRQELKSIVESSDKWDGKVCGVLVTNTTDRTVELRALVSAADSGKAWDLRCLVREKLIAFLQREYPHCLPRLRAEVLTDRESPPTVQPAVT